MIICSLFFVTGCIKQDKKGNMSTIKLNFSEGDPPSLHPFYLSPYLRGRTLAKMLFEGLTRFNQKGEVELSGAKSVSISDSKKEYTFTLRENYWSNGEKVTAFQYEKAWKEVLSPSSPCLRTDLLYVLKNGQAVKKSLLSVDEVGVKAIDEKTLFVELEYPAPYFLELVTHPLFLPFVEPEASIFNGPFTLDEWRHNDLLSLMPNPFFWDREHVYIDRIEITMVRSPETFLALFEKNEIDWIGEPFCTIEPEMTFQTPMKSANSSRFFSIYLNTSYFPLSSSHIRKALSLGLDRQTICDHILIGDTPLYTPLPSLLSSIDPLIENATAAKESFLAGLEELHLSKEDFPVLLLNCFSSAANRTLAQYLKDRWESLFGIKIELECTDWTTFNDKINSGGFQIGGFFSTPLFFDPLDPLANYSDIFTFSKTWNNSIFREIIQDIYKQALFFERKQLVCEAEKILNEETPIIPLVNHRFLYNHNPKLKDFVITKDNQLDLRWAYMEQ